MSTKAKIEEILTKAFVVHYLEVRDDSAKHAGHAESKKSGGRHFSIVIVSDDFKGESLPQRHRMVYKALLNQKIHALSVKAWTISEHKNS